MVKSKLDIWFWLTTNHINKIKIKNQLYEQQDYLNYNIWYQYNQNTIYIDYSHRLDKF